MTGARRAAVLLMTMQALDKEIPGSILQHFTNEKIRIGIVREIGQIASRKVTISLEERVETIDAFEQMVRQHSIYGGWADPTEILDNILSGDAFTRARKGQQIIDMLGNTPFSFLKELGADEIWGYIQDEHPQTISLVLACLPSEKAATLLQQISPPTKRNDVARRIATMERVMPDALDEVQEAIRAKMEYVAGHQQAIASGPTKLAQILVRLEGEMQESVLEYIRNRDAVNAERVVENMLTFDDILYISNEDIARTLIPGLRSSGDLDDTLPLALKGASDALIQKFRSNMNKRVGAALEENMNLTPSPRRSDRDQARTKILEMIRQMEQAGSLTISRDFEEEEEIIE